MDEKQYLIFIYSRTSSEWENKTKEIVSVENTGTGFAISFNGVKTFNYGKSRVRFFQNPTGLNIRDSLVKINDCHFSGWEELYDFGRHYTFIGAGGSSTVEKGDIEIIPNIVSLPSTQDLLTYYRYLAAAIKDALGYLDYYYQQKLAFIREDSVAHNFAQKIPPKKYRNNQSVIFPFGINASQKEAVANALTSQISLIQGPPGTGKTQTILNIIANLLVRGKTIAVVAGNNSATDNVCEKLDALGMSFIAAQLGNKQNQAHFFATENNPPDLTGWILSPQDKRALVGSVESLRGQLEQLLLDKNNLAALKQEYERLKTEQYYFENTFDVEKLDPSEWTIAKKWALPNFLSFLAEVEFYSRKGELKWPTKLRWFFKYRMLKFKKLARMDEQVFRGLAAQYYLRKSAELEQEIHALEIRLQAQSYQQNVTELTQSSLRLFQGYLAERYKSSANKRFTKNDLKNNFNDVVNRFPVFLSTTDSIINCKGTEDVFDYIIVDEASQVDLLTGFLAFSCAKSIVAVGDVKQLPHIPIDALKPLCPGAERQWHIDSHHSYNNHSLLSSLSALFANQAPSTLLQEHYRCHPKIIDFCSQKFYGGKLITMTEGDGDPFRVIKTKEGNHARPPKNGKGYLNVRELEVINQEILKAELCQEDSASIGIISPYRGQTDAAKKYIQATGITMDTVYKFQGREKDTIIFTTASNTTNKFVDDPNLLNVAVSRAKNKFYLVTSHQTFNAQGSNLGDLLRHITYQSKSAAIFESAIVSIFDCLYKDFADVLTPFLAKTKQQSEFQSENLMMTLIKETLEEEKFSALDVLPHYSLSLFSQAEHLFTDREKQFLLHPNSHVDFIIFNKFDKSPVLAIEVDGYQFHELNARQKERDNIKNAIFDKMDILLIRFSTVESGERSKLRNALNSLFEEVPESPDEQI